jgi:hypothetical protein
MITIADRDVIVRGRLVRVAALESDGLIFPANVASVVDDIRTARAGIDVFTFVQILPRTKPEFSYRMEWDNAAALPVSTFEHWFTKQIDFKVRNKVRKGEKKGLTVREVTFDDALVQGISRIYNETPVRQGKAFWHYGKDLETVRRENSSFLENSIIIGAFVGDELVGFLKMVVDADGGQASVLQILSMIQHRDKAPTNALIAQAVRSCAARGIPYFVYANFSYGKKERDSLAEFKEANGFHRIEIPRYYVPLTIKGRLALRLGLHHRLAERIPGPVLERARQVRRYWYARKAA